MVDVDRACLRQAVVVRQRPPHRLERGLPDSLHQRVAGPDLRAVGHRAPRRRPNPPHLLVVRSPGQKFCKVRVKKTSIKRTTDEAFGHSVDDGEKRGVQNRVILQPH